MLTALKQRAEREDEGFTLIELMVVVLIIAILLAIAIPTFLGARDSANSRAAQSNLRNALTAEQTYWTNNQSWDTALDSTDAGSVVKTETSLDWETASTIATNGFVGNTVLVADDSTNGGVELTALGKDKKCYTIEVINQPVTDQAPAGTYYYEEAASGDPLTCSTPGGPTSSGATQGSAAKAATPTWSTSF